MWIRIYTNRQLARLGLWLTAKLANDAQRDQALAQANVHVLSQTLFDRFFDHRKARQLKFESDYVCVWDLTHLLHLAAHTLATGGRFDVAQLSTASRIVSIDQFFIDRQGRYIDPGQAVAIFKKEALAFLSQYYAIEKVDYGYPAFNRRVLARLLASCKATAQALKEFSL